MGLLDYKSKSNNKFEVSRYNFKWFDYDNMTEEQEHPEMHFEHCSISHITDKFNIEEEKIYPISRLIEADFSKIDDFCLIELRNILAKMNVINDSDRKRFRNLGIKEEHIYTTIDEMNISTRPKASLKRMLLRYMWQLVEGGYDLVRRGRNLGTKGIEEVSNALNSYGYVLRGYEKEEPKAISEEEMIEQKIHLIKKAKQAYVKQIDELNAKIEEADKNIAEEEKKLKLIRKNNQ